MIKIVWKGFMDYEKEEKWLNHMAEKGWNFRKYSFLRYTFEKGTPGEYIYRMELLGKSPDNEESKAYVDFMKETSVEVVDTYQRWIYFRKNKSEGTFDLYTDYDSRIKFYKRLITFIGPLILVNLFAAIYNLYLGLFIGHEQGFYGNAYVSIISWAVTIVLIKMAVSYMTKIRKMEKERQLYE
ncbi:MAG: DUF2812 domain-containing protein [Clostridiales bacterium]|nr:DUF2812 domain-containing protein [Clostridiales bacterium]